MNKIKTYIINLPTSYQRRNYITELLNRYPFIDSEIVEAVNGRELSCEERENAFDYANCMRHMGRHPNEGEVGCVLSHHKCYHQLLNSENDYALILEDDIAPVRDLNDLINYDIEKHLISEEPTVLFLSGDFWYFKNDDIVKAYDAVGAYAYIINRAAAWLILSVGKPRNVADDWRYHKHNGLKLRAIRPYMIDANVNMTMLPSDVKQDSWTINRRNMAISEALRSYTSGLTKRILKMIGHFESKIRIIDNMIK